jgi:ABC-type polar amino acid transport system ATPase subunit
MQSAREFASQVYFLADGEAHESRQAADFFDDPRKTICGRCGACGTSSELTRRAGGC